LPTLLRYLTVPATPLPHVAAHRVTTVLHGCCVLRSPGSRLPVACRFTRFFCASFRYICTRSVRLRTPFPFYRFTAFFTHFVRALALRSLHAFGYTRVAVHVAAHLLHLYRVYAYARFTFHTLRLHSLLLHTGSLHTTRVYGSYVCFPLPRYATTLPRFTGYVYARGLVLCAFAFALHGLVTHAHAVYFTVDTTCGYVHARCGSCLVCRLVTLPHTFTFCVVRFVTAFTRCWVGSTHTCTFTRSGSPPFTYHARCVTHGSRYRFLRCTARLPLRFAHVTGFTFYVPACLPRCGYALLHGSRTPPLPVGTRTAFYLPTYTTLPSFCVVHGLQLRFLVFYRFRTFCYTLRIRIPFVPLVRFRYTHLPRGYAAHAVTLLPFHAITRSLHTRTPLPTPVTPRLVGLYYFTVTRILRTPGCPRLRLVTHVFATVLVGFLPRTPHGFTGYHLPPHRRLRLRFVRAVGWVYVLLVCAFARLHARTRTVHVYVRYPVRVPAPHSHGYVCLRFVLVCVCGLRVWLPLRYGYGFLHTTHLPVTLLPLFHARLGLRSLHTRLVITFGFYVYPLRLDSTRGFAHVLGSTGYHTLATFHTAPHLRLHWLRFTRLLRLLRFATTAPHTHTTRHVCVWLRLHRLPVWFYAHHTAPQLRRTVLGSPHTHRCYTAHGFAVLLVHVLLHVLPLHTVYHVGSSRTLRYMPFTPGYAVALVYTRSLFHVRFTHHYGSFGSPCTRHGFGCCRSRHVAVYRFTTLLHRYVHYTRVCRCYVVPVALPRLHVGFLHGFTLRTRLLRYRWDLLIHTWVTRFRTVHRSYARGLVARLPTPTLGWLHLAHCARTLVTRFTTGYVHCRTVTPHVGFTDFTAHRTVRFLRCLRLGLVTTTTRLLRCGWLPVLAARTVTHRFATRLHTVPRTTRYLRLPRFGCAVHLVPLAVCGLPHAPLHTLHTLPHHAVGYPYTPFGSHAHGWVTFRLLPAVVCGSFTARVLLPFGYAHGYAWFFGLVVTTARLRLLGYCHLGSHTFSRLRTHHTPAAHPTHGSPAYDHARLVTAPHTGFTGFTTFLGSVYCAVYRCRLFTHVRCSRLVTFPHIPVTPLHA